MLSVANLNAKPGMQQTAYIRTLESEGNIEELTKLLATTNRALKKKVEDSLRRLQPSAIANEPVHTYLPDGLHSLMTAGKITATPVFQQIEICGSILPGFYFDEPVNGVAPKFSGSFGRVFDRNKAGNRYIIKRINSEKIMFRKGLNDTIKDAFIRDVNKMVNELNINLELTRRIPHFVSRCLGTYLKLNLQSTFYEYEMYIVYEYLEGVTLEKLMNKTSAGVYAPIPFAKNISDSLQSCLENLHGAGYVHRDMKPDNIFVVMDGDKFERCILIDFGESLAIGTVVEDKDVLGENAYNPLLSSNEEFLKTYGYTVTPAQNMWALEQLRRLPRKKDGISFSPGLADNLAKYGSNGGKRTRRYSGRTCKRTLKVNYS
jgi:serine/threonine protein kinase